MVYQVTLDNEVYRTHALQLLSPDTHATRGSEALMYGLWDSSGTVKDDLGRRLKWRAASDALENWKKRESERSRNNSIQNESAMLHCSRQAAVKVERG